MLNILALPCLLTVTECEGTVIFNLIGLAYSYLFGKFIIKPLFKNHGEEKQNFSSKELD